MAIEKSTPVEIQQLRADCSPDDYRICPGHAARNLSGRRRGIQHHAGERLSRLSEQTRGKSGISASSNRQQAA